MLKLFRKKSKGFTLIELLIVVAIIGILAAIAIPNLLQARRRANNSRAATDSKQIVTQVQLYINDNNKLPATAPAELWDKSAPNATVYMAATYDPWGATPTTNYIYDQGAGTALTNEIRAWSIGPDTTDNTFTGDDVGYSSYTGLRN